MIFLSPIWLLSLLALSIPVAIHLWNIRPGKTLKVGSIALIDKASRKSSRSFNLSDFILLLLRCLLLALIALFLAIPIWRKYADDGKVKGWVLIPEENFTETYHKFKPQVDSLTRAGYEFHYFDAHFPKAVLADVLAKGKGRSSTDSINQKTTNYWTLLQQLDQQIPKKLPVALFTPNTVNHISGLKPFTTLNLKWRTFITADSTSTWPAVAWFTGTNTVKVALASSKPSGTSYTYCNLKTDNDGDSPFHITINNGTAKVALKSDAGKSVNIDTTAQHIAIYADKSTGDARYLHAALTAVAQFTQRKTDIKIYNDANAIPAGQSWIYWLSEKPAGTVLNKSKRFFIYEPGKQVTVNSWISSGSGYSVSQNEDQIALFKRITIVGQTGRTIWRDGFGQPVLSVEDDVSASVYHFYSRFSPAWNDLVWSTDFPKLLLKLSEPAAETAVNSNDRRVIDQQQLLPEHIEPVTATITKPAETTDLSKYFWIALMLIFLIERWLAHQTKLTPTHG